MLRFGQVIGLRDEREREYRRLHDGPGVRDLLIKANVRNFNIFLQRFPDGKLYEFAYFEYTGADYESDMAWLDAQPAHRAWLDQCDPMQIPLPGANGWTVMQQIYFNP
jgi:L-rhamnose mutarotase